MTKELKKAVTTLEIPETNELILSIKGVFKFEIHREFRSTYKANQKDNLNWIIDLSGVTVLDSSALGLLLIFREEITTQNENTTISIRGVSKNIGKVLEVTNFGKLFTIK